MVTEVNAADFEQNVDELLNRVQYRNDSILISKDDKPVAALVDASYSNASIACAHAWMSWRRESQKDLPTSQRRRGWRRLIVSATRSATVLWAEPVLPVGGRPDSCRDEVRHQ
jgi:prevent-host-death family protein